MLQADPNMLRYLAQQILAGVDHFRRKADQLNDTVQRLVNGGGWKGDGANAFMKRGEILVSEMRKACNQLESVPTILQTLARRVEDIQYKRRELEQLQNQLSAMHGGWDIRNDAEIVYLEGRIFALSREIEAESMAADLAAVAAFEAIQFCESLQEQWVQLSQVASTVANKTEEVWDNYVKPAGEWLWNGVEEFLDIPEMIDAWHDLTNPNLSMGERLLAAGKILAYGALDVSMLFGVGDVAKGVQLLAKFGAKYGAKLLMAEGRKEMTEAITKGLSEFADGVKSGAEQFFSRGTPGKYRLAFEGGETAQDLKVTRVKFNSAGEIEGKASAEGVSRLPETEVKFNQNPKHDSAEFTRQLKAQEEGMNKLTVDEYLKNRQKYIEEGRALEGDLAQQAAREQAYADKVIELREKGLSTETAEKEASKWMDTQAALHNPDQIAGGDASTIGGMGDRGVNSSLGAQWKYRIDAVDEQIKKAAEGMSEEERKSTYLNVKLRW